MPHPTVTLHACSSPRPREGIRRTEALHHEPPRSPVNEKCPSSHAVSCGKMQEYRAVTACLYFRPASLRKAPSPTTLPGPAKIHGKSQRRPKRDLFRLEPCQEIAAKRSSGFLKSAAHHKPSLPEPIIVYATRRVQNSRNYTWGINKTHRTWTTTSLPCPPPEIGSCQPFVRPRESTKRGRITHEETRNIGSECMMWKLPGKFRHRHFLPFPPPPAPQERVLLAVGLVKFVLSREKVLGWIKEQVLSP